MQHRQANVSFASTVTSNTSLSPYRRRRTIKLTGLKEVQLHIVYKSLLAIAKCLRTNPAKPSIQIVHNVYRSHEPCIDIDAAASANNACS